MQLPFRLRMKLQAYVQPLALHLPVAWVYHPPQDPAYHLKSEGLGLAVITELPLVVVDVQRGGPSTGLPTKTEQSDLFQALYGRHGECQLVVLASSTPANCFDFAFEASRIAIEHMTPVILLSDGYLANGSELWKIPALKDLPEIKPRLGKRQ